MPATVYDAYHLLRQALTQPDPVVFIEHKGLYALSEEVDLDVPPPAWGKAVVRRKGSDLVIVTYSRQVHFVLKAAEELSSLGIEATKHITNFCRLIAKLIHRHPYKVHVHQLCNRPHTSHGCTNGSADN